MTTGKNQKATCEQTRKKRKGGAQIGKGHGCGGKTLKKRKKGAKWRLPDGEFSTKSGEKTNPKGEYKKGGTGDLGQRVVPEGQNRRLKGEKKSLLENGKKEVEKEALATRGKTSRGSLVVPCPEERELLKNSKSGPTANDKKKRTCKLKERTTKTQGGKSHGKDAGRRHTISRH